MENTRHLSPLTRRRLQMPCPHDWPYCSNECRAWDYQPPTLLADVFVFGDEERGSPPAPPAPVTPEALDAALSGLGLLAEAPQGTRAPPHLRNKAPPKEPAAPVSAAYAWPVLPRAGGRHHKYGHGRPRAPGRAGPAAPRRRAPEHDDEAWYDGWSEEEDYDEAPHRRQSHTHSLGTFLDADLRHRLGLPEGEQEAPDEGEGDREEEEHRLQLALALSATEGDACARAPPTADMQGHRAEAVGAAPFRFTFADPVWGAAPAVARWCPSEPVPGVGRADDGFGSVDAAVGAVAGGAEGGDLHRDDPQEPAAQAQCPVCGLWYDAAELERHVDLCLAEGVADCPVCGLRCAPDELPGHVERCLERAAAAQDPDRRLDQKRDPEPQSHRRSHPGRPSGPAQPPEPPPDPAGAGRPGAAAASGWGRAMCPMGCGACIEVRLMDKHLDHCDGKSGRVECLLGCGRWIWPNDMDRHLDHCLTHQVLREQGIEAED